MTEFMILVLAIIVGTTFGNIISKFVCWSVCSLVRAVIEFVVGGIYRRTGWRFLVRFLK